MAVKVANLVVLRESLIVIYYSGGHKFCPYFCLARSTNDIVIQTLTFALRTAALSH